MFGKNYDDEIKYLREYTELLAKNIETLTELLEVRRKNIQFVQEHMLKVAEVQTQHKIIITFLLNHGTIGADAAEDLKKMLMEVKKIEEVLDNKTKKKKK